MDVPQLTSWRSNNWSLPNQEIFTSAKDDGKLDLTVTKSTRRPFGFEDLRLKRPRVNLQTCYSPRCCEVHDAVDQHMLPLPQSGGSGPRRAAGTFVPPALGLQVQVAAASSEGRRCSASPCPPRVAGVLAGGRTPSFAFGFLSQAPPGGSRPTASFEFSYNSPCDVYIPNWRHLQASVTNKPQPPAAPPPPTTEAPSLTGWGGDQRGTNRQTNRARRCSR